jgi:hypothetical protein
MSGFPCPMRLKQRRRAARRGRSIDGRRSACLGSAERERGIVNVKSAGGPSPSSTATKLLLAAETRSRVEQSAPAASTALVRCPTAKRLANGAATD